MGEQLVANAQQQSSRSIATKVDGAWATMFSNFLRTLYEQIVQCHHNICVAKTRRNDFVDTFIITERHRTVSFS